MISFERYDSVARRFWRNVLIGDGCWEWKGTRSRREYGQAQVDGKRYPAHRLALILTGTDVPDDLFVLHSCDNPCCVRPSHLRVGTNVENVRDMFERGREHDRKGEAHGLSKLTDQAVVELRHRAAAGECVVALAAEFGVAEVTAHDAISGRTWAHVPGVIVPVRRSEMRGERAPGAKVTAADVVAIRARAARGEKKAALAREFGLSDSTVFHIVSGKTWKHVPLHVENVGRAIDQGEWR